MSRTLASTPAADGFRMPAEFEPHRRCWMLWPERPDNWRDAARPAQLAFAQVAAAIARFEPVILGASTAHYATARALLPQGVRVVEMAHDDCWMRDVGPTCVVNARGRVRGVDWRFNAWGGLDGGLYFPWDQDDLVARKVLEVERLGRYRAPLIKQMGQGELYFQLAAAVANAGGVFQLSRELDFGAMPQVIADLERHWSEIGQRAGAA